MRNPRWPSSTASEADAAQPTADVQLLAKWQGISTRKWTKYENKNPAGNVAALEAFIGTLMPSLTFDNYNEKISTQDREQLYSPLISS